MRETTSKITKEPKQKNRLGTLSNYQLRYATRRSIFKSFRREIKADVKKQHDLYVNNLIGDIELNPTDFYRYIYTQTKDSQGIPSLKRRNDSDLANSELEQADEFNDKFTDVFNKSEHTQIPLPNRSAPKMEGMVGWCDGAG